jgi:hypothetical protein
MPGLIESSSYATNKKKLCAAHPRMDDVIDAMEWQLQCEQNFGRYNLITSEPEVRAHHMPATATTPGAIVVFTFEDHGGEKKVLLLEAWIPQKVDDP